ncbi:MAG: FUSC family protein, partial [Phyllobacteriaceae bacterium]|nr:FUSC family protein [Phyllobacteriaceae bacterium]
DAACARLLRRLAARDGAGRSERVAAAARALSEIAEIDDELDPHGAGSPRSRRLVRVARARLISLVAGLLWLHAPSGEPIPDDLARALRAIADRLEDRNLADLDARLAAARALAAGRPRLGEILDPLFAALADDPGRGTPKPAAAPIVVLHRDWVGAGQAMVRSAVTLLMVGALWLATGWSGGPFLLLGTAIMTSLFSTFDNPAQFMRHVFLGQVYGAAGALACRWLVWPLVDGEVGRVVTLMPFVLLGIAVFAHRRTRLAGFDYNMVVLLLSQPIGVPSGTFAQSLALVAAVAAAPIAAWVAYRLVYPLEPRHRLGRLVAAMIDDLRAMARDRDVDRIVWRWRLYHRLLRAIRWGEKAGRRDPMLSEGGLAVLDLGSTLLRLRDLAGEPSLPAGVRRAVELALARAGRIDTGLDELARALRICANRLGDGPDADRLRAAAATAIANRAFFRLVEGG